MIVMWSTGKAGIMDSSFCVLKELFEMRKRRFYGSVLIKRGAIGIGGFMEMPITINSGQKYWLCGMS